MNYPDGNPKTAQGAKKPPMWLNPFPALIHLATAFADGAAKYGPFNWRKSKVSASVYIAAAQRHIGSYEDGEEFDPVSKVHHLAHAMACMAIVLDAKECGALNDDRPAPAPSAAMIKRFAEFGTLELQTKDLT